MIRFCADIRLSHVQGITLDAVLKEVFCPGGRKKGECFSCGKEGHFAKECQNKPQLHLGIWGPVTGPLTGSNGPRAWLPRIFTQCRREKHWANECHSKTDTDGQPLIGQGNFQWGLPWHSQTVGTITMQAPHQYPPLRTSFMPPQEAQDWTSVPPPDTC
jgi:hypothetical protein